MSHSKSHVNLLSKSSKFFSKLLILYPMIHPSTIHGLLVEYNYDYGFVLQLVLKLESQRNVLYWEEVAHASHCSEIENCIRMNFYKDITNVNQRLTEMMDNQMSSVMNWYDEQSDNTSSMSQLMNDSEPQMNEISTTTQDSSKVFTEFVDNGNFLPINHQISGVSLNDLLMADPLMTFQPENISENNINPAPLLNEFAPAEVKISPSQKPKVMPPLIKPSIVILENKILQLPNNSTNWNIVEVKKIPQSPMQVSNSNPNVAQTPKRGPVILENKLFKPARINTPPKWHIPEMPNNFTHLVHSYSNMSEPRVTPSQNSPLPSKPKVSNQPKPQMAENKIRVAPQPPSNTYRHLNIECPHSQIDLPNNEVTIPDEFRTPRTINSAARKKKTTGLREYRKPKKNVPNEKAKPNNQNNATPSNTSNMSTYDFSDVIPKPDEIEYIDTSEPGMINVKTANHTTKWRIFEIKSPDNSHLHQDLTSNNYNVLDIKKIPNAAFNFTTANIQPNQSGSKPKTWQISDCPNIQMVLMRSDSPENSCGDSKGNKKSPPAKRANKQKIKTEKIDVSPQTPKQEAVKRRSFEENKSDSPIKKSCLESEASVSDIELVIIDDDSETNSSFDSSPDVVIKEKATKGNNRKGKRKLKNGIPPVAPKKKAVKKTVKREEFNLIRKKTRRQYATRANFKKVAAKPKFDILPKIKKPIAKKKLEYRRAPQPVPAAQAGRIRNYYSDYDVANIGTNFLGVDPHITKIEVIPEGHLITVCPTPQPSKRGNVQFIKRSVRTSTTPKPEPPTPPPKKEKIEKKEVKKSPAKSPAKAKKMEAEKPKPKNNKKPTKAATLKTEKAKKARGRKPRANKSARKKPATKVPKGKKVATDVLKSALTCCCLSIEFRKKYNLPPFDKEGANDLFAEVQQTAKITKRKKKVVSKKTIRKTYNTRSKKNKNQKKNAKNK